MAIRLLLPLQMKPISGSLMMYVLSEIKGWLLALQMKPISGCFFDVSF
jgi:hypothetical protein